MNTLAIYDQTNTDTSTDCHIAERLLYRQGRASLLCLLSLDKFEHGGNIDISVKEDAVSSCICVKAETLDEFFKYREVDPGLFWR